MKAKIILATKKLLTTTIEWVLNSNGTPGYAINLWVGCTKISLACGECYAEKSRVSKCLGVKWGDDQPRKKCKTAIKRLLKLNKKAQVPIESWARQKAEWNLTDAELIAKGFIKPPRFRCFINQSSDIYDNKVPQQWRDEFWEIVEQTPYVDYIFCTKRIGNAKRMIPQSWLDNGYPANVWQLITVCNQAEADRDIPNLLNLKCTVRGLSIEPLLGEIDLWDAGWHSAGENVDIDWVIVGGESGTKARPMNPNWVRKIRDQCVAENVPFLFKRWGEWIAENQALDFPLLRKFEFYRFANQRRVYKIGTKRAGHLLDGKEWQQMPDVQK